MVFPPRGQSQDPKQWPQKCSPSYWSISANQPSPGTKMRAKQLTPPTVPKCVKFVILFNGVQCKTFYFMDDSDDIVNSVSKKRQLCGIHWLTELLLMEEILHLGCKKPCKWDLTTYQVGFLPSTVLRDLMPWFDADSHLHRRCVAAPKF